MDQASFNHSGSTVRHTTRTSQPKRARVAITDRFQIDAVRYTRSARACTTVSRAQLLRWRKRFRREMASTLAEKPEWSAQAWEQLSRSVDQLANGEAYFFHGWELPDDHPARVLGVNIDFMLGADDVLRVAP